jgi:hypothetical protein
MNKENTRLVEHAFLLVGAGLLLALAGCYVEPSGGYAYSGPATQVIVEDDYVYYPDYECYYAPNRRQFVYRDGRSWVYRPAPRGVSVDVLLASPSVRMSFRDSPERHHAEIVRQYPRHWAPQPSGPARAGEPDNYVYYPGHELYYNTTQHQYVYRDGRSWVTRPEPPRAAAKALPAAPSVPLQFHDTPAQHHPEVVKTYPKNWKPAPPEPKRDHKGEHKDDREDDRRDDHKDDRRKPN